MNYLLKLFDLPLLKFSVVEDLATPVLEILWIMKKTGTVTIRYGTDFRRTCQVGVQKSHSEKSRICPFIACKMQSESQPPHVDHINLQGLIPERQLLGG